MKDPGTFRRAFLLFLLPTVSAAIALGAALQFSRDDVLRLARQGYPGGEIVRLIRVSGSRFALAADDVLNLRAAGVGDDVLKEMLSRSTAGGESAAPPLQRSQVRISGSGGDVRLERRGISSALERESEGIAADLVRLRRGGVSEEILLAYVQSHRSEIPVILSADDYARLRRSRIGETVLGYLAGVSAIDVGATGEPAERGGAAVAGEESARLAPSMGMSAYSYGYATPYGGNYSHFPRHHFLRPVPMRRRPILPPGFLPRPLSPSAASRHRFGRLPVVASPGSRRPAPAGRRHPND
jgi:hypothetical protein